MQNRQFLAQDNLQSMLIEELKNEKALEVSSSTNVTEI